MLRGMLLAACAGFAMTADAAAFGSCSRKPAAQTQSRVDNFKARPAGLLDRYLHGEPELSGTIALVIAADPAGTLDQAIELLRVANVYQRRAIGRGLGSAAQTCQQNGEADTPKRMVELLRRRNERDALDAFAAVYNTDKPATLPKAAPEIDKGTPMIGKGWVANPETDVFGRQTVTDPLRPLR